MLARYMDLLLKKSRTKTGEDLEDKADEAIIVFRFIKDKDTFLKVWLLKLYDLTILDVSTFLLSPSAEQTVLFSSN